MNRRPTILLRQLPRRVRPDSSLGARSSASASWRGRASSSASSRAFKAIHSSPTAHRLTRLQARTSRGVSASAKLRADQTCMTTMCRSFPLGVQRTFLRTDPYPRGGPTAEVTPNRERCWPGRLPLIAGLVTQSRHMRADTARPTARPALAIVGSAHHRGSSDERSVPVSLLA